MSRSARVLVLTLSSALIAASLTGGAQARRRLVLSEFTISEDALCRLQQQWTSELLASNERGTWAPLEVRPTNAQLATMGLPSKRVLTSRSYPTPTLVTQDGRFFDVPLGSLEAAARGKPGGGKGGGKGGGGGGGGGSAGPTVASYAGTGCLGIRPGAWVLLLSGGGVGWCSLAHVYGSPGSYDISTAGHCGKVGDTATVIAALGNRPDATGVVLLDFGTFAVSRDNGLGQDWALIDVRPEYQGLVSPTMCFWGGPRGMYTATGDLASVTFPGNSLIPQPSVTPDPFLAQAIVHYGHGAGIGAGGTPRAGTAISWRPTHFMFEGAIAPGDSGSGANTLTGDSVGANMEAAGIITHIWIDPLMRSGIGIMGGTRATQVSGTLANGQIVPYPAPAPGLP